MYHLISLFFGGIIAIAMIVFVILVVLDSYNESQKRKGKDI